VCRIAILDGRSINHQPDDAGIIAITTKGAMTMNGKEVWIWLAVGLVPYRIAWKHLAGGVRLLEIRALFWSLELRLRRSGRHDWTVRVPLVERVRDAVWSAVMRLRGGESPEA
jgi:hypothetical protein